MTVLDDQHLWDSYNHLLLSPDIGRIKKLLVRYELFKQAINVPGDIVECGVFKGAGWMYWLKLCRLFVDGQNRRVIGFDTFSSFADSLLDYERDTAEKFVEDAAFSGISADQLLKIARNQGGFLNADLVAGDVLESVPAYSRDNPGFRIALLHLDLDTYHGTKVVLDHFFGHLSPGGLIVLDEYGKRGWGESDAVDEFLKGKNLVLESVPYSDQPSAFIVKS